MDLDPTKYAKIKLSMVPGRVPHVNQLDEKTLVFNVPDGLLYGKKSV